MSSVSGLGCTAYSMVWCQSWSGEVSQGKGTVAGLMVLRDGWSHGRSGAGRGLHTLYQGCRIQGHTHLGNSEHGIISCLASPSSTY